MKTPSAAALEARWARHGDQWRHPAEVATFNREAARVEPSLLAHRADRAFFDLLEQLGVTLLVTREYEHLLMAFSAEAGRRRVSYFPLPHPSGLAIDRRRGDVFVASTRNPNQVFRFRAARSALRRRDLAAPDLRGEPLVPTSTALYPGCLYLHDLAWVGGSLYANAVGQNAVVQLSADGAHRLAWWPKSVEQGGRPRSNRNYLQLNSIAAGATLASSYFSASSAAPGRKRPGQLDYPTDGRGVIFSGKSREPICRGLTRPHSARLHQGEVWVANSGYGEVGIARGGKLEVVARLPGWTRGLCFVGGVLFVATSRVIPRFAAYAPGLDPRHSRCGLHALDPRTGKHLASLTWPYGNQVFGIDWIPRAMSGMLPFNAARGPKDVERLFYAFSTSAARE